MTRTASESRPALQSVLRISRTFTFAAVLASVLLPWSMARAVTIGDQFGFVLNASLFDGFPVNLPDAADGTFTIASPDATDCALGVTCFHITLTSFNQHIGPNPTALIFSDTNALFFDATTFDLGGDAFFETLGQLGGLHETTWTFFDGTRNWSALSLTVVTGVVDTLSGNYTLSSVPEPNILLLIGSGLAGFFGRTAWRKRRRQ